MWRAMSGVNVLAAAGDDRRTTVILPALVELGDRVLGVIADDVPTNRRLRMSSSFSHVIPIPGTRKPETNDTQLEPAARAAHLQSTDHQRTLPPRLIENMSDREYGRLRISAILAATLTGTA